jgi:hypothetical protein
MLFEKQIVVKVTAAGTNTVVNDTCFLLALIASVVTPGTLGITIQDRSTAPNKLVPPFDLTPPGAGTGILVRNWSAPKPVRMNGGIDIVATGTGEVHLWLWHGAQTASSS